MFTGNTKNWRNVSGQLVVEVSFSGEPGIGEWLPTDAAGNTYFASFAGWYRQHHVGNASTPEQALADLAAQSQTTIDWIEQNCEVREVTGSHPHRALSTPGGDG